MIVTKITGGMGNQMFMYALGFALAEKHHTKMLLDLSGLNNGERIYAMDKFKITHKEIWKPGRLVQLYYQLIRKFGLCEVQKKIAVILRNLIGNRSLILIAEKSISFDKDILLLPDNVILDGYWITSKYFSSVEKKLRKEFRWRYEVSQNTKYWEKIIRSCECAVSLHVRRGDYVSNNENKSLYCQLGNEYYYTAVDCLKKNNKNMVLFVFSNDVNWCKENLKFSDMTYYVSGNDEQHGHEDMYLMSLCTHNIVANSTFSWWGAWLNSNPDKIVVCPKKYYNIKNSWFDSEDDIWPSGWTKI